MRAGVIPVRFTLASGLRYSMVEYPMCTGVAIHSLATFRCSPGPTVGNRGTAGNVAFEGRSVMRAFTVVVVAAALSSLARAQPVPASNTPLPDIRVLMHEVQEHQKALEKVRESYTYSSRQVIEDLDPGGNVTRTETAEYDDFFVNGHLIQRMVKKNGQPLSAHDDQKETERVTKLVEKAEKTPPDQPLEGPTISVSRVLEIMDVHHARLESFRGRSTIVFDFVGRKDARTHGLAEDMSKKLEGTIWIDERDRQVAHLEVTFRDNFRMLGGLVASIEKGSSFRFDQAPMEPPGGKKPAPGFPVSASEGKTEASPGKEESALWLPTGGEGTVQARVLMLKNYRQHFSENDFDFKRFQVETQQGKDARAVLEK